MTKTKKTLVPLADLTDDARFQSRTRTDTGTVDDYKESMANFQQMLKSAPTHPRAPEAMLAISNVQIELKDLRGARKTMDELKSELKHIQNLNIMD